MPHSCPRVHAWHGMLCVLQVISYLEAENQHTRAVLADTEALQDQLYHEMRGRIQEADQSTPTRQTWESAYRQRPLAHMFLQLFMYSFHSNELAF